MRNKIEMRVILMGVYGDEWKMDAMPCKMRLRCGTKSKWNIKRKREMLKVLTQRGKGAERQRFSEC